MKKIVALFGSRRKNGNTVSFVKAILGYLPKDECDIEYIFPQDFKISPCIGCGNCFEQIQCIAKDELYILQKKILDSDLLIVASPVYLHYMSKTNFRQMFLVDTYSSVTRKANSCLEYL